MGSRLRLGVGPVVLGAVVAVVAPAGAEASAGRPVYVSPAPGAEVPQDSRGPIVVDFSDADPGSYEIAVFGVDNRSGATFYRSVEPVQVDDATGVVSDEVDSPFHKGGRYVASVYQVDVEHSTGVVREFVVPFDTVADAPVPLAESVAGTSDRPVAVGLDLGEAPLGLYLLQAKDAAGEVVARQQFQNHDETGDLAVSLGRVPVGGYDLEVTYQRTGDDWAAGRLEIDAPEPRLAFAAVEARGKQVTLRRAGERATRFSVSFRSTVAATGRLVVRDADGDVVRTQRLARRTASARTASWDWRRSNGRLVRVGSYVATLELTSGDRSVERTFRLRVVRG